MRRRFLTIEDMEEIAKLRGGHCLSRRYVNANSNLKWQCKKWHSWEAKPSHIKNNNSWCPYCYGNRRATIEDMHKLAKSKGGTCLSKKYINGRTKLKWRCKKGHIFEARPDSIKNKNCWCSYCSGNRKNTIEEAQKIAKSRKGECLSKKYVNNKVRLKWRCHNGHIWKASLKAIKVQNCWCPHCSNVARLTIDDMQEIAKSKGGKCLSNKYSNLITKLKWKCKAGHIWEAKPNNIRNQNQWCPICSKKVSERICRGYLEKIFGKKFPTKKPKWLINSRGNRMELDGFCRELNLAFEYHGIQHYKKESYLYKKKSGFKRRIQDDLTKRKLCKKNDVVLIEIPYKVKYEDMGKYIVDEYKKKGIDVPKINKWDYKSFENIYSPEKIKEMEIIAKNRGGQCLSKHYATNKDKLKWKCSKGHTWKASPNHIMRNQWCPFCAKNVPIGIDVMQKIAKSRGGECLSNSYVNSKTKLNWKCKKGHIWKATPASVKKNWCSYCSNQAKHTLQEMQEIAKSKSGKCLSEKYISNKAKLKWKCSKGHVWETIFSNIMKGRWCPYCRKNKKK